MTGTVLIVITFVVVYRLALRWCPPSSLVDQVDADYLARMRDGMES